MIISIPLLQELPSMMAIQNYDGYDNGDKIWARK